MNLFPMRHLLLLAAALVAGCAGTPVRDERDPLEGFNRAVYQFNDDIDRAVMRPVAEGYQKITPRFIDDGITNFFNNLNDVTVLINDLLQLKFAQAASDLSRLAWNSTVGLLGFIDVATPMGLEKHNEDFGQTLGYWGVGPGPYLVLPFLGPSSVRDGFGTAVDYYGANPVSDLEDPETRWGLIALNLVDTRAGLLRASRVLDTAALDPYAFLRDAYLQRRQNLVYDGSPPPEEEDDEFDPFEEFPPLGDAPSQEGLQQAVSTD